MHTIWKERAIFDVKQKQQLNKKWQIVEKTVQGCD